MSSHVKLRKERVSVVDYDIQIKEVRSQLVDQLKVLDLQLEQKNQQLQDLTDYLRRRGEIESEYARSLEKLAERFTSRIKSSFQSSKFVKEPSSNSVSQAWLTLLSQTRQESRDHNGLSESCSNFLTQPLTHCVEYTQRLAKKSKDICIQLQDGLLKVTTELQAVREKPTTQNVFRLLSTQRKALLFVAVCRHGEHTTSTTQTMSVQRGS
uniref:Rho GTPase activating protein 4a n=1 Tax=Neolamprologus brichardi TaxID=32507 RepID=A0A3Q4MU14_NEOBR